MRVCLNLLAAIVIGFSAAAFSAQPWPTETVRVVVPFGAGSTTDIVPRVVFAQLAAQLRQPVVVENRPGAGGTVGTGFVAAAKPNGYTLLVSSTAYTIAPALYSKLNYNPSRDFAAVISLGTSPNVLVVAPAKNFKTVGDLVAAAKTKPEGLTFASVGVGSATHMSAERFCFSAGVKAVHVPFKGGAEAMAETVAGRVDFFFGPLGLVLPQIRAGKLRALVVSGAERAAALPDVPTTREAGFADAEYPIWFGLFAPAKTPPAILDTLHDHTLKALRTPQVRDKLSALGVDPMIMTRADFAAYIEKQFDVNAALAKAIGLQPE